MPLFKKSSADNCNGSLLEAHKISLRQCRRVFLKDLEVLSLMDYMTSEDCFRQDQRDMILAFPTREQQATAFLDHLETKGERVFALFMEALKVRQKHLYAYLSETNQTIDEWDMHWNSAKTSVNGIVLQKMFAKQKHESIVQNGKDNENATGESESQDDCYNYISCYSVTTKGHQQKEKWITHNDSLRTDLAPTERKSYMAVVSASLIFRRIDWTAVKTRVDIKKPPNSNIPMYIFEKECNAACKSVVAHDLADSPLLMLHKKKEVQEEDAAIEEEKEEEESKSCIPNASARVRNSVPPPVPPKPSTLPARRLGCSLPHTGTSDVQDVVPLVRSKIKTSLVVGKVRPPVPKKKPVLRMPLSQSAHSALRTPTEFTLDLSANNCELRKSESNVCKRVSLPETSPDDVNDKDVDADFLDYNVSIGSTLELEDILQNGENYDNEADDIANKLLNAVPRENHFDMDENMAIDAAGEDTAMHNYGLQIKSTKQPLEESVNHVEVRNGQMHEENALRSESQQMPYLSSCPEFDDGRKCNTNGSEAESAQNDLSPRDEQLNDECLSKTTSESISANKIIEKENLFFHSQSVDQPVFADDEFSSDNSYYEEIEQFFSGRSSPTCQSHNAFNAYLDPRTPLLRKRSSNRSSHHYATEESRKFGRKFLCRNSLLLVSCDTPYVDDKFPGDSSDDVEVKNKSTLELDSSDFSGTSLCFDKDGSAFYVPRQFLKKYGDPEGEIWFYPVKISAREASLFLMCVKQEGCFVVYRPDGSSPNVAYNLSLCLSNNDVVHYHIVENAHGDYGIQGHDHTFLTVGELVEYFRRNKSTLAARLRRPLRVANQPITPGYHYDICHELDRNDVSLTGSIIGQGNFGVVCSGMYQNRPVAVKVLQQVDNLTAADEDDFIEEALAVMTLRHDHIVRFIGVSCRMRPYFLVTEYMSRGNLKDCLRNGFISSDNVGGLFGVCIQIVSAMQYLENIRYMLHRDLAARNFLVDNDLNVKLADFGRARIVSDDCYQAPRTEKICIKWAAPEVLVYSRYSTKSDVWSFGVVLWEVFSAGARPFSIFSGEQTAMYVTGGGRLDKPSKCPSDIYEILRCCWCEDPGDRPSFCELSETLKGLSSVSVSKSSVRRFHSRSLSSDTTNLSLNSVTEKIPSQRKSVTSSIFGTNSLRKTFYDNKSSKSDANHENLVRSKGDAQHILSREGPLSNYLSDLSIASACSELVDIDREDVSRGDRIRKSLRKLITKKSKTKFNELSGKSISATQEFIAVQ